MPVKIIFANHPVITQATNVRTDCVTAFFLCDIDTSAGGNAR